MSNFTGADRFGTFSTPPRPRAGTFFYCTACNQRSQGDHCLQCEPPVVCPSCGLIAELCCCNPELDVQEGVSSEPTSEAEFDELIEQASVPSLDALFQRAIKKGVISGSSPVYSWKK